MSLDGDGPASTAPAAPTAPAEPVAPTTGSLASAGSADVTARRGDPGLAVRDAGDADLPVIQAIYAHHVRYGLATFEEVPPSVDEIAARRAAVVGLGLPYLVAELDGRVVGYCYATSYRPRPAYRYTIEDSIYLADGLAGRGIGALLLGAMIARCEAGPWRQMIAIIGNSENAASIALHRRLGFAMVGTLASAGYKLGRWVDTVIMQRALGPGGGAPPAAGQAP